MDNKTQAELRIYNFAKASLGRHMTLDPNVPAYFGCAEAVSAVLRGAGFPVPAKGIAGTASLEKWVQDSKLFEQIPNPEAGALIFSSTEGSTHGHTGVVGKDSGVRPGVRYILSNNSDSGLFLALWDDENWKKYYVDSLGLDMNFYRAIDQSC